MFYHNIFLGNNELKNPQVQVEGGFVDFKNEKYYKISNFDRMPAFFMSIASDADHWMFISSNGSLTAGRKNRDNALFPYDTVDKIHDSKNITGSKTIVLANKENKTYLWEPFLDYHNSVYRTERNLYKNIYGNKIVFEDINHDLGLKFQYGWYNSDKFGFVKKSSIANVSAKAIEIRILDGIRNILPYGADFNFQNVYSNLLDAYKKNELIENSGLGLFTLSSVPVDRPEPSEALKATTVWSIGLDAKKQVLLSDKQVGAFKTGMSVETETDIRAARGCYFVCSNLLLEKELSKEWYIIAELNQDATMVANLANFISSEKDIINKVEADIDTGTENLIKTVAMADGIQVGNKDLNVARHFSNTMFNVMRGGVFKNNYRIEGNDFRQFVQQMNNALSKEFSDILKVLPDQLDFNDLEQTIEQTANAGLKRIFYEYMPLVFSRRHGDPSRPWNQFSIEVKNDDGSPRYNFEGNWRDIFQNWEALGFSYPQFIKSMINKFVNASTVDGYNPYRISRSGIDWECPDPDDPWAYIGYWGDHQVIYLQKLLELSHDFYPGKIDELLTSELFVYANVPYRIKPYGDIVKNPMDTIEFDALLNDKINNLVKQTGADGRLVFGKNNQLYRGNLTEKILVSILAKLTNFIPEAGIWLNTQRPEWNDANNALVGNGVSMVTLYYIRRSLYFWNMIFSTTATKEFIISEEVRELFDDIVGVFKENVSLLASGFTDEQRKQVIDDLGQAGSKYRTQIYNHSFSENKNAIRVGELLDFTELSLNFIDHTIRANRRNDGLFHAYNLVTFTDKKVTIRYLYEMLEGQVAVLSSGILSAKETVEVLGSLRQSKLFRPDQYSYILYPDRQLARFTEKNNLPAGSVKKSQLLGKLIEDKDTSIITRDDLGNSHFNGTFRNAGFLEKGLDALNPKKYGQLVDDEKQMILDMYEEMFDHQSFTGRSGTFYGYEGLGSIYWHMVSKLLLAVQENYFWALRSGEDKDTIQKIKEHYYQIQDGIGVNKSPDLYGAFPTDAYSHTPAGMGAKQPGMTGQVKEDVLSRLHEVGIIVANGEIEFNTSLLHADEFLTEIKTFEYYDVQGEKCEIKLEKGQFGFTYCQVPVVYTISQKKEKIEVTRKGGRKEVFTGNKINKDVSSMIFERNDEIQKIEYYLIHT